MTRTNGIFLILVLLLQLTGNCCQASVLEDATENVKVICGDLLKPIQRRYASLPPKGKFVSTAVVGFVTSKCAVKTTVKAAKIGGAAFIVSEVLDQVGVLDNVELSEDSSTVLAIAKRKMRDTVNDCRHVVKDHLSIEKMRSNFRACQETDKLATMGFTTGAVAGLVW